VKPIRALPAALALLATGCPDTERPVIESPGIRTCTADELAAFQDASDADERTDLFIAFIDVGQGDATWIRTPGHLNEDAKEILVDSGDDGTQFGGATFPDGPKSVRNFMHFMRFLPEDPGNPIDFLIASHADKDHIGGMHRLIDEFGFHVGTYIDPGWPDTTQTYQQLLATIHSHPEIEARVPLANYGIRSDELGRDVTVQVLSADQHAKDANGSSIVMVIEFHGVRLLLTGDMETELEDTLLAEGKPVQATILKAGHHGAQNTSSQEFLDHVFPGARKGPRYAIISAGERHALPYADTVQRLLDKVGPGGLYRTDRDDEGKTQAQAPGDDHVIVRVTEQGQVSVCYAFPDPTALNQ
jgi:beta-lactamase superfamily II metal-dependent hydrolase